MRIKNCFAARTARQKMALFGTVKGADFFTALGLLAAHACGATIQRRGGVYLASGGRLGALLQRHPLGAMQAVALGRVILAPDAATLRQHLRHEWVHVRQFMRWGALFPALYFLELLRQVSCGKDAYLYNRFECEARRNEL